MSNFGRQLSEAVGPLEQDLGLVGEACVSKVLAREAKDRGLRRSEAEELSEWSMFSEAFGLTENLAMLNICVTYWLGGFRLLWIIFSRRARYMESQ